MYLHIRFLHFRWWKCRWRPDSSSSQLQERAPVWRIFPEGSTTKEIPQWKGHLPIVHSVKAPYQYFQVFFYDDLLQFIVDQSNLYAVQVDPEAPLRLTKAELEQYLGTVLFMTIFHLPRTRLYWASSTRVAQIADVFSRKRWEDIKKFIHFNDNSKMLPATDPHRDKLFKVRPLIDSLLSKFQFIPQQQMLCVDEQIVPFKGKSSLKKYKQKKKKKKKMGLQNICFFFRFFFFQPWLAWKC